jgi:hypothetical protein
MGLAEHFSSMVFGQVNVPIVDRYGNWNLSCQRLAGQKDPEPYIVFAGF